MTPAPNILISPYKFCAQDRMDINVGGEPPDGWTPGAATDLDRALPFAWDPLYTDTFGQDFQPVKFWKNAAVLCQALDRTSANDADRERLIALIMALVDRMRSYTVEVSHISFIENRFAFTSPGISVHPGWVSAISNAFAILGCCEIVKRLPGSGVMRDIRRLADAYFHINVEGQLSRPDRWITMVDTNGYVWFDEYPMEDGRATLVLNGHIFAILALYKTLAILPDPALHEMARAGITTAEAYTPNFRRAGKANLYSLHGGYRSDYLPTRSVRQQYELYKLTGAPRFLGYARAFRSDMAAFFGPADQSYFDDLEVGALRCRDMADRTSKGLRSNGLHVAKLDEWRAPDMTGHRSARRAAV
jgi:hypothetical protein